MEILEINLEEQLLIEFCMIKHLILLKNSRYDGYLWVLASLIYNFFYKKPSLPEDKSASSGAAKSKIMSKQELASKLHKPIVRKLEKREVQPSFIDKIWVLNLWIGN